jgi:tetratricopeptide (TPR) repeat protein
MAYAITIARGSSRTTCVPDVDSIDGCLHSAGPETDAGWEYTAQKAHLLTTAYPATSDKAYLCQAIAVYESRRRKWPKNNNVLNNLAYLLAQNDERLAEALEYAGTAAVQDPDAAHYLDTYGYLLYRNGRSAQAARSLALAVQQYEGDPKRGLSRWGLRFGGWRRPRSMSLSAWCTKRRGTRIRPWRPAVVRWMREGPPCPRPRSNGSGRRWDD